MRQRTEQKKMVWGGDREDDEFNFLHVESHGFVGNPRDV